MPLSTRRKRAAALVWAAVLLMSSLAACSTGVPRASRSGHSPRLASRQISAPASAGEPGRRSPEKPGQAAVSLPAVSSAAVASGASASQLLVAGVNRRLGAWLLVGRTERLAPLADQGLATVRTARGPTTIYRGSVSVTPALRAQGWDHVGDPDSWGGWVVDAFQGGPDSTSKMFRGTSPSGVQTEVVHPLVRGEAANNSFAAITPDGRWTLSAEWGTEWRLLVFPTPVLNPAGRPGSPLPLAGVVTLTRPVRNLQGCAFATATRLLCSASDPGRDLWPTPDPLLEINLQHALSSAPGGASSSATVSDLGGLPQSSACQGSYEPEGVDLVRPGDLRVEVRPPGLCGVVTQIYEYRLAS
jgi:hypothetical protein